MEAEVTVAAFGRGEIDNAYFSGTLLSCQAHAGLRLAEVAYEAPNSCSEHKHEPAFFSLLLQGRYSEARGNERTRYETLDLRFHPKGSVHSDAVGTSPARFFLIEIPDSWTEHLHGQPSVLKSHLCDAPAGWLAARLYREHCEMNFHCPLVVEAMVSQLLSRLVPEPYVRGIGVNSENGRPSGKTRFTDIFVYRDERWQCVAGHDSRFPEAR